MAITNMFLKLNGLDGESMDEDHKDWIEVESFSWGVDNPASFAIGQGGPAVDRPGILFDRSLILSEWNVIGITVPGLRPVYLVLTGGRNGGQNQQPR